MSDNSDIEMPAGACAPTREMSRRTRLPNSAPGTRLPNSAPGIIRLDSNSSMGSDVFLLLEQTLQGK